MDQRLLVAAALTTVMRAAPIVVGGTAEEYWTGDEYAPTDLDLIPGPTDADERAIRGLGFKREGRHWVRHGIPIVTEFPYDESFEVRRTSEITVGGAVIKLIGVDDLYLDRLGQSTMAMNIRDQHFASLMAIALTNWDNLDWVYIGERIAEILKANPRLGAAMKTIHGRCRRRARNALATKRAASL